MGGFPLPPPEALQAATPVMQGAGACPYDFIAKFILQTPSLHTLKAIPK